jgi:integrase
MSTKPLTDLAIRAFLKQATSGDKVADGQGLCLHFRNKTPKWRLRYRIDGKARNYTIGSYPDWSLQKAREEAQRVRRLLAQGIDPVIDRQLSIAANRQVSANVFDTIAREWFDSRRVGWSNIHYVKSLRAYERDIAPFLGHLPIAKITTAMVSVPILQVHRRGATETASRELQHLNCIFRYAQAKGLVNTNPADPVDELLPKKRAHGHMAAVLSPAELGDILVRAERAHLSPEIRMAHRLCAYTAMRIGNIVEAEWKEFDLDSEQPSWTIPRQKMKVQSKSIDHRVPLCKQIAQELRRWRSISRTAEGFVFPALTPLKHITREGIEKVYRVTLNLAGKHSPHGWRSAFSTLAREAGFPQDVVELALDHVHDSATVRAYDRGDRYQQRVRLYEWWGDLLSTAESSSHGTS